ncbi:MAG: hypothetical protein ABFD54_04505 [Armatimonadota bacterium]
MVKWDTIKAFITRELAKERRAIDTDDQAEWLRVANEFILSLGRRTEIRRETIAGSTLTQTNGIIALPPSDIIRITAVRWDSEPLERTSRAWLDENYPGWTTLESGTAPDFYITDGFKMQLVGPVGSINLLELDCVRHLPLYTDAEVQPDAGPWDYIPDEFQMVPAYLTLTEIPFDPENSIEAERYRRNAKRVFGDGTPMYPNKIDALIEAITTISFGQMV